MEDVSCFSFAFCHDSEASLDMCNGCPGEGSCWKRKCRAAGGEPQELVEAPSTGRSPNHSTADGETADEFCPRPPWSPPVQVGRCPAWCERLWPEQTPPAPPGHVTWRGDPLRLCPPSLRWPQPPSQASRPPPHPRPAAAETVGRRWTARPPEVIANWGEKGPNCLAGPEEPRGLLKAPGGGGRFAQQLPPGMFADYVSAGEQGAQGQRGGPAPGGLPPPRPLDNAVIVSTESG
ncbi:uncharacterized protein LOC114672216 [Macaca mulatta]